MSQIEINKLFNLLDEWRLFPDYQLERRADLFFAFFIKDIIESKFNDCKVETVIPEFPLRKGTIEELDNTNRSVKLDYLVKCDNKVIFVELKTDMKSKNKTQLERIIKAKGKQIPKLIDGILQIYNVTTSRKKYKVLLDKLVEMNWLEQKGTNYEIIKENSIKDLDIEIVYLQPNKEKIPNVQVIDFEEIAKILDPKNSFLASRFAESLRKWKTSPDE